ncbi:MAG: hypothetical protein AB7D33_03510 [Sphingobium sp.]
MAQDIDNVNAVAAELGLLPWAGAETGSQYWQQWADRVLNIAHCSRNWTRDALEEARREANAYSCNPIEPYRPTLLELRTLLEKRKNGGAA